MSTPAQQPITPPPSGLLSRLSGYAASGLRYWEPRRLVYNGVLALVVLVHFFTVPPETREPMSVNLLLVVFLLAVLANIAYCAAYLADLFVQFAGLQEAWRKGRVVLLAIGTMFAAAITHFFALGLFSR